MPKKYGTPGPRLMLPTVCTSVPVSGCSIEAQLLFDRLIAQADDQGRLQGEARVVAALCMPLVRQATETRVSKWLGELGGSGLIQRYASEGRQLIQITGWWDNQGTPRRAYPSRYPAPEGWTDRVRLDGTPPPEEPQPADKPPADRGQDDGAHAHRTVPSLPVPPQPVPSSPTGTPRAEKNGQKPKDELATALLALSEKFQRGEIDQLAYERERRVLAS